VLRRVASTFLSQTARLFATFQIKNQKTNVGHEKSCIANMYREEFRNGIWS
jgi:hypothetical protein